jgi:hypothetical protein
MRRCFDIASERRVLQDIVSEALAQGVWITRARRLPRAGACRGASEHPPRYHGCAVAQGVRARCRCYKGCRHQGACEAEMSALAASGGLPTYVLRYVILFQSISHTAPVDYIYYSKYSCS